MDNISLELTGFGFWLALALVVIAIIWAGVKKHQMKHELMLKLLEKGQDVDQELLAKLLLPDNSGVSSWKKSSEAQQNREGGGFVGFVFTVAGLIFAYVGIDGGQELSWPLIALGAFSFGFGVMWWIGAKKDYEREKAEEKLSRN